MQVSIRCAITSFFSYIHSVIRIFSQGKEMEKTQW